MEYRYWYSIQIARVGRSAAHNLRHGNGGVTLLNRPPLLCWTSPRFLTPDTALAPRPAPLTRRGCPAPRPAPSARPSRSRPAASPGCRWRRRCRSGSLRTTTRARQEHTRDLGQTSSGARTGDVVVDELLDERRGGVGAAGAGAGVFEVAGGVLELLRVVLPRHAPDLLIGGGRRRRGDGAGQVVVVRPDPGVRGAEGGDAGAGERGEVEDGVDAGEVLLGVGQRVREDQPALGVTASARTLFQSPGLSGRVGGRRTCCRCGRSGPSSR